MSNKIKVKDLGKMIKEALLNEKGSQHFGAFKKLATNRVNDPTYGKKGDLATRPVEAFLKLIGAPITKNYARAVQELAKSDGDATDISNVDLENAYKNQIRSFKEELKDIMNRVAYYLLSQYKIDKFKSLSSAAGTGTQGGGGYSMSANDIEKYEKSKLGVDKPNKGISIDNEFIVGSGDKRKQVRPPWFDAAGGKNLDATRFTNLAGTVTPNNILDGKDFLAVLRDPKHPEHFWAVEFIEDALVMIDQDRLPVTDEGTKGIINRVLRTMRSEVPRIDTQDKALGRDKPIPNVPIQSRYGGRTGHTTPETLQRIFSNLGANAMNSVLPAKFTAIKNAVAAIKNNPGSLDIEKTFSSVMVYDYLVRIVQDYEASASGFLFENFLAFLTAGTKEGGNLKIEDFSYTTGQGKERLASAKLYRDGTKKFKGSAKLMYNAAIRSSLKRKSDNQVTVSYVLAMKGQNIEDIKLYKSTIYLLAKKDGSVEVRVDSPSAPPYDKIIKTSDGKFKSNNTGDSQMEFDWPSSRPIATIDFSGIGSDRTEYERVIGAAMDSTSEKLGTMMKALNNIQVNTTKYFSILPNAEPTEQAKKLSSFDESLASITNFRNAALTTFTQASQKGLVSTSSTAGQNQQKIDTSIKDKLEEQKVTSDLLKKIIKETLKK
jgi:hypothetical protein